MQLAERNGRKRPLRSRNLNIHSLKNQPVNQYFHKNLIKLRDPFEIECQLRQK